jgi:antitoxin HigA-1
MTATYWEIGRRIVEHEQKSRKRAGSGEELEELGCSARELARALDVPVNRITGILREERGITADTALRLARYFTNSPEFWLNLQSAYDLR